MWKAITKQLFRRIFSYGCRKSWYAGEWSKPVPMAKSAPTAAATALRRLSFAANCPHQYKLQDFIKQHPAHLEAFDKTLVKRWLERIIVWEDHFTVELKSGLKIDIEG